MISSYVSAVLVSAAIEAIIVLGLYIIIRRLTRGRPRWVRKDEVLKDLEQGKINVDEAVEKLGGKK